VKLTTLLHLVLRLRILRAVPLLPAHFHGAQSDFTFSYSFHVDIYYTAQPEPTRSDTQAEKQFHHCHRFSQALCFAVVFTTIHRQLSGRNKSLLRLAEGVFDTIYYGPNAVQLCWFGGSTAAKLCKHRLQYEIMDDK
jgi:hypothetical protein